jgi:hypothetical protein
LNPDVAGERIKFVNLIHVTSVLEHKIRFNTHEEPTWA